MQRHKLLLESYKLQPENTQNLGFVGRYEDSLRQRDKFCKEGSLTVSNFRSSFQKSKQYSHLFWKQSIKRRIKHSSFEKCYSEEINDFFITNHLEENLTPEEISEKCTSGLRPLFKIKRRKVLLRKWEKSYRQQIQLAESIKQKCLQQQKSLKSASKGITETSFYKNYKSNIQKKKEKQKQRNRLVNKQSGNSSLRSQHIDLLKKYSLKLAKSID